LLAVVVAFPVKILEAVPGTLGYIASLDPDDF
jgi:hypothetical protein